MREMARIVARAGLLSPEMIKEFERWGFMLPEDDDKSLPAPTTKEQLVDQLTTALESEDMVLVKETDLEVLHQYLKTLKVGLLHVEIEVTGQTVDIPLSYGMMRTGEYIMPWSSESIEDVVANGMSYLLEADGARVFFESVRELYYGDNKSFIVCKASMKEPGKVIVESSEETTEKSDASS